MTALVGARLNDTYSAATLAASGKGFGLGDRYVNNLGNEFVFVQAASAIAQYDTVFFTAAYAASSLGTANDARGNLCGVAPVAFAANEYGWVQVKGPTTMNVKASCAANVRLNTTATAGSPDDDGTATTMQIQGMYLTTARGGTDGSAPGILSYPFIDATL
ncbi:hypothetical protein [Rhizobium sp. YTU87027]|uniref:hypothetical protein n=1 Tax=Rhizobium sp. YTU87027 TaxID=3417741 RepID=UPI003D6835D4